MHSEAAGAAQRRAAQFGAAQIGAAQIGVTGAHKGVHPQGGRGCRILGTCAEAGPTRVFPDTRAAIRPNEPATGSVASTSSRGRHGSKVADVLGRAALRICVVANETRTLPAQRGPFLQVLLLQVLRDF